MKRFFVLAVLAVFAVSVGGMLAGCEKKEPEPKPEANLPPPEPSPEEIAGKIRTEALGPVVAAMAAGKISPEVRTKLVDDLTKARSANQATDNGKKALEIIKSELEGVVTKAKLERKWDVVLAGVAGYEVFQKDSAGMARIKEQAEIEGKKPIVTLKGFMSEQNTNKVYAFLTIQDPMTGTAKDVQVAEGEEFDGLRFNKVIGDQRGIELEYLAIPGDMFEVKRAD